jgi:L-ascorbate metabolism protein UlaG (beta-lactamase superfamily)
VALWKVLTRRLSPDNRLLKKYVHYADAILVSLCHYDHMLDVPEIANMTGARVYGSPNTTHLAALMGVPRSKCCTVLPGDRFSLGRIEVMAFRGEHTRIFGRRYAEGDLGKNLSPPLRAYDYRADMCLSYAICANGLTVRHWNSIRTDDAPPADVLFVGLYREHRYYAELASRVRTRILIPIHWDDMFRPLESEIKPTLNAPANLSLPTRVNPYRLKHDVETRVPGVKVEIPERLSLLPLL